MESHLIMLAYVGKPIWDHHGQGPFPRPGVPDYIKGDNLLSFLPFLCLNGGCGVAKFLELLVL